MIKLTKENIYEIAKLIKQEKIVALPTDTIYGFSCLATSDKALKNLCNLKQCSDEKLFIVLVSKAFDMSKLAVITDEVKNFIQKNTPNPVTMILQKQPNVKLAKNFKAPTIALRVPKDEFLQKILSEVDFMISTSCNVHGQPNLNNCKEIIENFESLDAIVETNMEGNGLSSTIVDLTTSNIKILRQGSYVIK